MPWGWSSQGQPRKIGPRVTHTLHPTEPFSTPCHPPLCLQSMGCLPSVPILTASGLTKAGAAAPIPPYLPGGTHLQVRPSLAQHIVGPAHCEGKRDVVSEIPVL